MTEHTDTTKHPLHLMPPSYLATCYIQTLKDDRSLSVRGGDEAIADIRANSPEFVLGTNEDLEERYAESVKLLFGQVVNGNLVVDWADGKTIIENARGSMQTKGTPLVKVASILSIWQISLLSWSGKFNNPASA